MMLDKPVLRARMRATRDAFARGRPPIAPVAALIDRFTPGVTVACYFAVGGEADPSAIARAAARRGCVIALPHVTVRAEPMRFLAWETEAALVGGPYGLSQPADTCADLRPDIILTPLVAFDAALNRLGQGAGYYDRAFAAFPDAWRVGVAWSVQQVAALPLETWDVPLHAILTESGWIAA